MRSPELRVRGIAYYALGSGGWRDWWVLLHPPYTAWHLSYVVMGAALAPVLDLGRLAATLLAFALAPTEVERATILGIHERANADAMAFMEQNIGFATMGANGKDGVEPAKMAWISFQHFTARPTVDIAMTDKAGVEYTERREVHDPHVKPDPNIHTHNAVATVRGQRA